MRFKFTPAATRLLQGNANFRHERMRAAHHAPRGPFRIFERRQGLADVVERGGVRVGERPRPDLNTPDRRRGGSVQPAGDFRRGSASSGGSGPTEIELTRSGSDSKARSPFWGGASP